MKIKMELSIGTAVHVTRPNRPPYYGKITGYTMVSGEPRYQVYYAGYTIYDAETRIESRSDVAEIDMDLLKATVSEMRSRGVVNARRYVRPEIRDEQRKDRANANSDDPHNRAKPVFSKYYRGRKEIK